MSTFRYCPECKNDSSEVIAAGEKLRYSKKKSGMMSKKNECNRDWGKVGAYQGGRVGGKEREAGWVSGWENECNGVTRGEEREGRRWVPGREE